MALNDIKVPKENEQGTFDEVVLTPSEIAAVPTSRSISAGTGLTGGGDLSANRTLAVAYGTTSGTSCQGNDARLSDSRTPTAHAASHNSATKASFFGTVGGMTGSVWIVADNAGTAGNSITLSFNGTDDIDTVLAAWNSANPSNAASLTNYGGDGSQIPDNGEEIVLSGGAAAGSDALPYDSTPRFDSLVVGGDSIGGWIQSGEMLANFVAADGISAVPLALFGGAALFEVFQDSNLSNGFAHGLAIPGQSPDGTYRLTLYNGSSWNPKIIVPQTGAVEISENLKLKDLDNGFTATLDAQGNLNANRLYDLPDASGTLALTSDIPANTIASTIVDAKGDLLVGTAADTVARLPVGATNGHVLTVDSAEASGMKWAAASGGVTSVSGTAPIVSSGGTTPTISVTTGSTAGTVAAGDDSRFHARSHAMTGTSDHTAGNWSVFYSNGSGQVTELALGAANTVLTSNGASAAPSFAAASGGVSAMQSIAINFVLN